MNKENRRIYSHHRSSQGQGKLEPLRVNIPVKKQIISTEEQPQQRKALQPAVTNTDRASIRVQHRPDPTKSKKRVASELVNEQSVPSIIHDVRRNLKYQKHECIGLGGFAKVFRVMNEHGKEYAAKVIAKASLSDKKRKEKLLAEINIHRSLLHEYIVQYHSCFEDKSYVYIITEYCQNETLNAMLVRRRKLTEDEVRYIMGQILSAVRYISDNRIVHRDIKLGNVFLDKNMNCKLGDFGLSARLVNEFDRRKTTCGTPHYIAPEILFDSTGHNHRADMWSAGVLMYTLLFGKHPFHHDERRKLYQIVKQNKDSNTFSFPSEDFHVSADAKNLISSLLVNNPDHRLTVTQALKHPFFLSHNIPENLPRDALFKQPSHKSLYPSKYNNISSQSKVADSIRHAANENESYVDQSIQPPLELLEEVILDHRTHFPIKQTLSHTSRMVIPKPNIPSVSLKRKYSNMDKDISSSAAKRINTLNNNNTNDANSVAIIARQDVPTHDATNHIDTTKGSSTKRANASATTTKKITEPAIEQISKQSKAQTGRKPIIEEMAEKLKIMIERKEIRPVPNKNEIESYKEGKIEWNRGNVFIKSWLDGSKRYGFCYCLSDDTLGVLYNDGSTLTTHDEKHYYYLYQQQHSTGYIESTYIHDQFPANLEKKRHILQQFKCYNVTNLDVDYGTPKASYPTGTHVLKYAVDKNAISFKLSNGVVQV
ncbi:unnamed protein product [Rhizopus microsporus]